MSVFYVFSVGTEIDVDLTYLGRSLDTHASPAQIHIDTPWFLPDCLVPDQQDWSRRSRSTARCSTRRSVGGDAGGRGRAGPAGRHARPGAQRRNTDPTTLYSYNQLAPVPAPRRHGVVLPADLTPVAVDADIAITFTNPVANDAAIATQSYPVTDDPDLQKVQDLTVRYALKSVQIQRRPRFGAAGRHVTDLVVGRRTPHWTPAASSTPRPRSRSRGTPTAGPTA